MSAEEQSGWSSPFRQGGLWVDCRPTRTTADWYPTPAALALQIRQEVTGRFQSDAVVRSASQNGSRRPPASGCDGRLPGSVAGRVLRCSSLQAVGLSAAVHRAEAELPTVVLAANGAFGKCDASSAAESHVGWRLKPEVPRPAAAGASAAAS